MVPVAAICGYLAWPIANILWGFTTARYVDPESFFAQVNFHAVTNIAIGAAFVYSATLIAPAKKIIVAIVFAGLALLLSGAMLFAAIMVNNYWAIFGAAFMNVGSCGVAYSIYSGAISFNSESTNSGT